MNFLNLIKIASTILLNKTRAMLTMLGNYHWVASVIAMLAIGEGSKESIKKNISSMGVTSYHYSSWCWDDGRSSFRPFFYANLNA